mgnify:CR=1 FL=1
MVQNAMSSSRDESWDGLVVATMEALNSDPTFGGLAFGLTMSRPEAEITPVEGGPGIKSGTISPIIEYAI